MTTEERLANLERELAELRATLGSMRQEVRTHALVVEDEDGNAQATLGVQHHGAALGLFERGGLRATLALAEGELVLTYHAEDAEDRPDREEDEEGFENWARAELRLGQDGATLLRAGPAESRHGDELWHEGELSLADDGARLVERRWSPDPIEGRDGWVGCVELRVTTESTPLAPWLVEDLFRCDERRVELTMYEDGLVLKRADGGLQQDVTCTRINMRERRPKRRVAHL